VGVKGELAEKGSVGSPEVLGKKVEMDVGDANAPLGLPEAVPCTGDNEGGVEAELDGEDCREVDAHIETRGENVGCWGVSEARAVETGDLLPQVALAVGGAVPLGDSEAHALYEGPDAAPDTEGLRLPLNESVGRELGVGGPEAKIEGEGVDVKVGMEEESPDNDAGGDAEGEWEPR
jgi:hypothetical protein